MSEEGKLPSRGRRDRRFKIFLIVVLCLQLGFTVTAANYFRNKILKLEQRVERVMVIYSQDVADR